MEKQQQQQHSSERVESEARVPKVEARASSANSKIVGRISETILSCEDFRDFVLEYQHRPTSWQPHR